MILNTIYQQKEIYKYTRVARRRNEKSIMDYILITANMQKRTFEKMQINSKQNQKLFYKVIKNKRTQKNHP